MSRVCKHWREECDGTRAALVVVVVVAVEVLRMEANGWGRTVRERNFGERRTANNLGHCHQ